MNTCSTGAIANAAGLARWVVIVAITFAHGCAARRVTVATEPDDSSETSWVDRPRDRVFPDVVACDVAEANGSVHVLMGRSTGADGKSFALTYTRSDDAGATWSEPVPIPTGHAPPTRMHRGDDPQVAVFGDHVMALWTARGQGPFGSGPLATALSDDGGRTWRAGPAPSAQALPPGSTPPRKAVPAAASSGAEHKHGSKGTGPGYRFPAAAAGRDGFHVVWIHAVGDERSLRHAGLSFGASSFSEATVIDPHICACCWNEVRCEGDGSLLALYRDQRPSDMSLAVSRDGGRSWKSAGRAGEFDWDFDGCPHVGGGIATVAAAADDPHTMLATVWTGNAGSTGAYVLRGAPGGGWSAPTTLAAEGIRGRDTDVAALPGTRTAAAVWDQSAPGGGGQCVYAAFTSDGGNSWSAPKRLSAEGENASYPRVVAAGRALVAMWTCYGTDGATSLRVVRVETP